MWCTASPTASTPRSSPPPRRRPGRCLASCTRTPAPGGPGGTLRVEIEGWVDPGLPARDADAIGRQVAAALARQLPEAGT